MMSDERAIARARIAQAHHSLASAALGQLRMLYAARIGSLLLAARGDPSAALVALQQERDTALDQLRQELGCEKNQAMLAVRTRRRRRRFRVPAFAPGRRVDRAPSRRPPYPNP
jgi:hypothetical protein